MSERIKILQINLNRSWGAFDLLKQFMIEADISLGILSEPPRRLTESNTCFLSEDGLSAILWKPENSGNWNCRFINRRERFVIVRFGNIQVISCYVSPNLHTSVFSCFLENLSNDVGAMPGLMMVCGF